MTVRVLSFSAFPFGSSDTDSLGPQLSGQDSLVIDLVHWDVRFPVIPNYSPNIGYRIRTAPTAQ